MFYNNKPTSVIVNSNNGSNNITQAQNTNHQEIRHDRAKSRISIASLGISDTKTKSEEISQPISKNINEMVENIMTEISIGDIIKEISNIKTKYSFDMNFLIDDINEGKRDKTDAMNEIVKYYREKNIASEMTTNKLIFLVVCVGMEVAAVRLFGLRNFKGLAGYLAGKMTNFVEFMHFMAEETVSEMGEVTKDANYHLAKLARTFFLEVVMFISIVMCSGGNLIGKEMLEKISMLTSNDATGQDKITGGIVDMVTRIFDTVASGETSK